MIPYGGVMARNSAEMTHDNYCWVEVDGRVVHVSHYVGSPRPRGLCPVCKASVVLHLGERKAHHYQHKGGISGCPLSAGETAKHYNAKHHVAAQLRAGSELRIGRRCPGDGSDTGCSQRSDVLFAKDWAHVIVETTVGSLRPDVLIINETGPIAAVEILVTHSVSWEKAEILACLDVPWIEVDADDALQWTADKALPVACTHITGEVWLCPGHTAARALRLRTESLLEEARQAAVARAEREQQEAESKLARQRIMKFIAVDAVSDTRRARHVFRVSVQLDAGETIVENAWLSCDQSSSFYSAVDTDLTDPATMAMLTKAVLHYMMDLKYWDKYECLEAPFSTWQIPGHVDPTAVLDEARYPARYRWEAARDAWASI
jgi:hypothetical protein